MSESREITEEACRICLSDTDCCVDLFEHEHYSILKDLIKTTKLKIKDVKGLPRKLCFSCMYKLEAWRDFIEEIVRCNKILLEWAPKIDVSSNEDDCKIEEINQNHSDKSPTNGQRKKLQNTESEKTKKSQKREEQKKRWEARTTQQISDTATDTESNASENPGTPMKRAASKMNGRRRLETLKQKKQQDAEQEAFFNSNLNQLNISGKENVKLNNKQNSEIEVTTSVKKAAIPKLLESNDKSLPSTNLETTTDAKDQSAGEAEDAVVSKDSDVEVLAVVNSTLTAIEEMEVASPEPEELKTSNSDEIVIETNQKLDNQVSNSPAKTIVIEDSDNDSQKEPVKTIVIEDTDNDSKKEPVKTIVIEDSDNESKIVADCSTPKSLLKSQSQSLVERITTINNESEDPLPVVTKDPEVIDSTTKEAPPPEEAAATAETPPLSDDSPSKTPKDESVDQPPTTSCSDNILKEDDSPSKQSTDSTKDIDVNFNLSRNELYRGINLEALKERTFNGNNDPCLTPVESEENEILKPVDVEEFNKDEFEKKVENTSDSNWMPQFDSVLPSYSQVLPNDDEPIIMEEESSFPATSALPMVKIESLDIAYEPTTTDSTKNVAPESNKPSLSYSDLVERCKKYKVWVTLTKLDKVTLGEYNVNNPEAYDRKPAKIGNDRKRARVAPWLRKSEDKTDDEYVPPVKIPSPKQRKRGRRQGSAKKLAVDIAIAAPPPKKRAKGKPGRPRVRPLTPPIIQVVDEIEPMAEPAKSPEQSVEEDNCVDPTDLLFYCPSCDRETGNYEAAMNHLKTEHTEENPIFNNYCKDCHVVLEDGEQHECIFQCQQCPRQFADQDSLYRHDELAHANTSSHLYNGFDLWEACDTGPPYTCIYCDKVFSTAQLKNQHENEHSQFMDVEQKVSFQCNTCRRCFDTSQALEEHVQQHGDVQFMDETLANQCSLCGLIFESVQQLIAHLQVEHPTSQAEDSSVSNEPLSQIIDHEEILLEEDFDPQIVVKDHTTCFLCNVIFPNVEELKSHVARHK